MPLTESSKKQEALLGNMLSANVQRAIYLLENYHRYRQTQSPHLDVKTSKLILRIVAECLSSRPHFIDNDRELFDKAGAILCIGIKAALDELRELPWDACRLIYPVLWEQYFHPDGPAISTIQLQKRLRAAETVLTANEIQPLLRAGQNAIATLIFENKLLSLWKNSFLPN